MQKVYRLDSRRCNAPAIYYAPSNVYRACDCHAEPNMVRASDMGPPNSYGRCDARVEYVTEVQ